MFKSNRWMEARAALAAFERAKAHADAQAYSKEIDSGLDKAVEEPYRRGRLAIGANRIAKAQAALKTLERLAALKYPRASVRADEIRIGVKRLEKEALSSQTSSSCPKSVEAEAKTHGSCGSDKSCR